MSIRDKRKEESEALTQDWRDYERCRDYLEQKKFYGEVDRAYRFYSGDQWGADAPPKVLSTPQINIIRRQVDYKVATVMGNGMSLNFGNAEFEDRALADFTEAVTKPLNNYIAKEWERNSMDDELWKLSQEACIAGAVGLYSYFDIDKKQIECQLKSNTDILFADEQEPDVQEQKFILLPFRRFVSDVRAEAKKNGCDELTVQSIISDTETDKQVGDYAKIEIDHNDMENGKCLCLLRLWKGEDGKVLMRKSTKSVVYQKDTKTGLSLYPIAFLIWNEIKGSARGKGDVTEWIPNQIEINKNMARRGIAVQIGAFPKLAYLTEKIKNPESLLEYGSAIGVEGITIDDVTKAVGYLHPTQMSPDAKNYVDELVERTQEMSGATQYALGNINPENASGRAILAMRDAAAITLTMQQSKIKRFVEDVGRIWWDIWAASSPEGKSITYDDVETRPVMENGQPKFGTDGQPTMEEVEITKVEIIPADMLSKIKFSVKVDVSPRNVYSKYAVEQTLEAMLTKGIITFEEYVEALPDDSIAPKSKLAEIIEDRAVIQQMQAQIAQLQQERDQASASYNELANLLPVLEQKGKEYLTKLSSNAKATDKTEAAT